LCEAARADDEAGVEHTPISRSLFAALAASLLLHAIVLFFPEQEAVPRPIASTRFAASLAPAPQPAAPPAAQATLPRQPATAKAPPRAAARPASKAPRTRTPSMPTPAGKVARDDTPRWSPSERQEMKRFLDELDAQAKAAPRPSLAQRSLAQAAELGRQQARRDEQGLLLLERRPDTPPPDPFSLDLYLDGIVRRLNRSAAFVRNDPRSRGMKPAAVQFRINPNGSLKSFAVLNAGDQQDEIAFIRSVVERSIPFAAFPPDIDRAARSLGVTICIQPGHGGGFGFTRLPDGRAC